MRNEHVKKITTWMVALFFCLLSLSPPLSYVEAAEPVKGDTTFMPTIPSDGAISTPTMESYDVYGSPLSDPTGQPIIFTAEQKETIVSLLDDLERQVQTSVTTLDLQTESIQGHENQKPRPPSVVNKTAEQTSELSYYVSLTEPQNGRNKRISKFFQKQYFPTKKKTDEQTLDYEMEGWEDFELQIFYPTQSNNYAMQQDLQKPSQESFVTVDSVEVGKELAAAHLLLNPPKNLHPFLRLLFYWRNVSPDLMRGYLQARQKIRMIYTEAKEGKAKIRYKGKIRKPYLPLPDEMGGTYELVISAQKAKRPSFIPSAFAKS